MIFISSFRPFDDDPTSEYQRNHLFAKASWERVATKIFLFNAYEPRMDSRKTVFIPSPRYPQILSLIELAAMQDEWACILNADIVIGPGFPVVEAKLKARRATCASSWRYNFEPEKGIDSGVYDDNGLDFFAAVPDVWKNAYQLCDERLHMSSTGWDCWMLSLFCTFHQQGFWNITKSRVIFHPRHGGRIHGPRVEMDAVQTYGWPTMTSAQL